MSPRLHLDVDMAPWPHEMQNGQSFVDPLVSASPNPLLPPDKLTWWERTVSKISFPLPYLHFVLDLGWIRLETAVLRWNLDRDAFDFVQLRFKFFRWKLAFSLYAPGLPYGVRRRDRERLSKLLKALRAIDEWAVPGDPEYDRGEIEHFRAIARAVRAL